MFCFKIWTKDTVTLHIYLYYIVFAIIIILKTMSLDIIGSENILYLTIK